MGIRLRRLGISLAGSGALIALAYFGLYVATAPRLVSIMVEPASMLLLPGLAVAFATSGKHDYSPLVTVEASFVFYAAGTYVALWWWGRRARYAPRSSR